MDAYACRPLAWQARQVQSCSPGLVRLRAIPQPVQLIQGLPRPLLVHLVQYVGP